MARVSGTRLRVTVEGQSFDARVDPAGAVHITPAGADESSELMVSAIAPGRARVLDRNGQVTLVDGVEGLDSIWVHVGHESVEVEVEEGAHEPTRRRSRAGSEGLSAPMPATVIRVLVTEGQEVTRGEPLVLLEAMKMELPIRAARDGTIVRIVCRQGELVQPGVPLLEMA
jgi:biotin carboxyl carrier protein